MLKHRRNLTFLARDCFAPTEGKGESPERQICPSHTVFEPQVETQDVYNNLYSFIARVYYEFGQPWEGSAFGDVLPRLMQIARSQATDPR